MRPLNRIVLMERLDLRELVNLVGCAPVGKAAGCVYIRSSRMSVVNLCREKLEHTSRGFSRRGEQRRRPEVLVFFSAFCVLIRRLHADHELVVWSVE
jgi:hypothetical protein